MKSVLIVFLVGVGAGLLIVGLKFGTIDPCGVLRAQIRQDAAREGGFGGFVASALPDGVIDGIVAAQFGPLSPGRCIALAFAGAPSQTPTEPRPVPLRTPPPVQWQGGQSGFTTQKATALQKASEEAKSAILECKNKRLSAELKTYVASAECSNPRILAAFRRAGYRYMDLIQLFTARRRELAKQVDNGTLTEVNAEREAAQFIVQINDEERRRDRGQK